MEKKDAAFWRGAAALLGGLLLMAVFYFISAGRLDLPKAWFLFALNFAGVVIMLAVMRKFNSEIVPARGEMLGELSWWDKIFFALYPLSFYAIFFVCGLDARFQLSSLGAEFIALGVAMFVVGLLIREWAAAENKFFEIRARIQTERGHYAITSGPYAIVRHPGYFGTILIYCCAPFILGSVYGLVPTAVLVFAFIFRTYHEDGMLQKGLKGYKEYCKKVRYRLVPFVW